MIPEPGSVSLPEPLRPSGLASVHEWLQVLESQYGAIVAGGGQGTSPGLVLRGKPVLAGRGREGDGRDSLFWHIITSGRTGEPKRRQRVLHPSRGACMGQAQRLLEFFAADDVRALWWREGRRVMVAPVDFSVLVVLDEEGAAFTLRTLYPVKHRRRRALFDRAAASWIRGESSRDDPPGLPAQVPSVGCHVTPAAEQPCRSRRTRQLAANDPASA